MTIRRGPAAVRLDENAAVFLRKSPRGGDLNFSAYVTGCNGWEDNAAEVWGAKMSII